MGMAASQARYLSLVARKTNTEYEGQQLNQQRLNLSNQSADLFNQMLTMSVPTCPDSNDYTTLQYTWSDGINTSVISDYYQLGTADEDYNYVVTSYYYEDVYTGSMKKLSDPQIQATKTNNFTRNEDKDYTVDALTYHSESISGAADDYYTLTVTRNGVQSTTTFERAEQDSDSDTVEEIDEIWNRTATTDAGTSYTLEDGTIIIEGDVTIANSDYDAEEDDESEKTTTISGSDYTLDDGETTVTGVAFTLIDTDDEDDAEITSLLLASYGANYDSSKSYYYTTDDDGNYYFICGDDVDSANGCQGDAAQIEVRSADDTVYYTDGTYYLTADELASIDLDAGEDTLSFHSAENDPTYDNFTAVGNCELTELSADDYESDETISTEIQQIIEDMKESSSTAYANLSACFDPDTGEYLGGIYTFTMSGTTYYTTAADLAAAVAEAYEDDAIASNGIDGQGKLSYYNATYVSTKIETTSKALLETDGSGRFTSVKFEDDSVVYTLSVETITDDDAYNDAMNEYYYEQEVYDQEVANINAKTEIIQAEDRELELRLEQLDTEQNALQTEMEACQKVVSKDIENSFDAFGGG